MGVLDSSMEVLKLAGKIANPELVQAATNANIEALELSRQNLELQKKAAGLEDQIRELDDKLRLTGEVFRENGYVYHEGDKDGCCSRCWDVERRLVHVIGMHFGKEGLKAGCPACKTAMSYYPGPNPRMDDSAA